MASFVLKIAVPLGAVILGTFFQATQLDLVLSDLFFNESEGNWPWRDHWLTETLIHEWGKRLILLIGLLTVIAIIGTWAVRSLRKHRKLLFCLLFAMGIGPLLVGFGKSSSHLYSPWDIERYRGPEKHLSLWDHVPDGVPVGHAFPSGHASGGFALMASYFALSQLGSKWRNYGLYVGLFVGGLFGLAQQMRGAHFFSHDMFSLAVCWSGSWLIFSLFYCPLSCFLKTRKGMNGLTIKRVLRNESSDQKV